ncbi:MAG: hotdog domain-containing protein [Candidatus Obscuribacterales bacterium]|nr:hotdog domain-containing protein [Candidatus Obscuribacterales bacterium]
MTGYVQHKRDPAIRVVLLPRDTNSRGTIFGGIILSYIDLAGSVEVGKVTRQRYVTVAMKEVVFKAPVHVGEVVSFYSSILKIGRTSVSVHVDVETDRNGAICYVTAADLTFVCVDDNGQPTPVIHDV